MVGHFDLVRLWSDEPTAGVGRWEGVWGRVVRNLRVVRGYGGVLEVNSAGLRKGLGEPYPGRGVCEVSLGERRGEGGADLFVCVEVFGDGGGVCVE